VLIGLRSLLALDIKLPGSHCLTIVGREGRVRIGPVHYENPEFLEIPRRLGFRALDREPHDT
jgi:hypothetical protein